MGKKYRMKKKIYDSESAYHMEVSIVELEPIDEPKEILAPSIDMETGMMTCDNRKYVQLSDVLRVFDEVYTDHPDGYKSMRKALENIGE